MKQPDGKFYRSSAPSSLFIHNLLQSLFSSHTRTVLNTHCCMCEAGLRGGGRQGVKPPEGHCHLQLLLLTEHTAEPIKTLVMKTGSFLFTRIITRPQTWMVSRHRRWPWHQNASHTALPRQREKEQNGVLQRPGPRVTDCQTSQAPAAQTETPAGGRNV